MLLVFSHSLEEARWFVHKVDKQLLFPGTKIKVKDKQNQYEMLG